MGRNARNPKNQKTFPGIDLMFHVPNGGARSIATASNLKASGVKPGVPDIFLPVPMGPPYSQNLAISQICQHGYFGLFIEMKAADSKKAKPSKSQLEMMGRLKDKGYACKVCYGFEQAKEAIELLKEELKNPAYQYKMRPIWIGLNEHKSHGILERIKKLESEAGE